MNHPQATDVAHPMNGICPDDMDWQLEDEDDFLAYWSHSHPCGCQIAVLGSDRKGWRVSVSKTCFMPERIGVDVRKRTIKWYNQYGNLYPSCNKIHQAKELARLLLAVWDEGMIAEYLSDAAERDSLVAAVAEDCEQLVGHAKETLMPWREKVRGKWFDDQMKYLHLSADRYDPGSLDEEIAVEITERYSEKWCERISADVLRMMDSEFESRHEKWRQVRQTLRWRSQR